MLRWSLRTLSTVSGRKGNDASTSALCENCYYRDLYRLQISKMMLVRVETADWTQEYSLGILAERMCELPSLRPMYSRVVDT
jgi:hypothetical protein